ncbi:hypothetical protein LBMAG56_41340 [Verrucomicrobiota bacterium]|nr:hypothetical protein LBMAG56_41340 [Verrucomicrobiota bacterium]
MLLALALLGCPAWSRAEAPVIESMFPLGGQAGTTAKVTFTGKLGPGPIGGWVNFPGGVVKPDGTNGNFQIVIPTNTPPGPYLLRLFNTDGSSRPRIFMVGIFPEITEIEPNDSVTKPQAITNLPVTINGRFDKAGDVDLFAVKLATGQTLVAEAVANMLGSSIDPALTLRDAAGNQVAFAHDGIGLDARLAYPVSKAGTYIVQLAGFAYPPAADVRFVGGKSQFYRLMLTTGAYLRSSFPAGLARGQAGSVQLNGWNLAGTNQVLAHPVAAAAVTGRVDFAEITRAAVPNRLRLALGDGAEVLEIEPNDTREKAQKITPPVTVNGRLDRAGDVDRFAFSARKGERFEFKLLAGTLGGPMDSVLVIEDAAGKELARVDDSAGDTDARLVWAATAETNYFVAVRDLFSKGGPDFVYRLEVGPPAPGFTVAVDTHAFAVQVGKTNELKLTVTPVNGYACTNLQVVVEGLPDEVTAQVPKIAAKGGEVKVSLIASVDAEPSNQPIRVLVVAPEFKPAKVRPAIFTVNAKDTSPELFINQTDALWLTVTSGPALASPVVKKKKKK